MDLKSKLGKGISISLAKPKTKASKQSIYIVKKRNNLIWRDICPEPQFTDALGCALNN